MVLTYDEDGTPRVVLGDTGEKVIVEMPGGNGEQFTIGADPKVYVTDEFGFDLTTAYWRT